MSEKWEAQKKLWQEALKRAVNFYLDNVGLSERIAQGTWEQGERVYLASEEEASILEVLARVAADQCERLVPDSFVTSRRTIPTAAQLFRLLEVAQFEQTLQSIRQRTDVAKAQARELQIDIADELTRLETMQEVVIQQFYSSRLPLDDDEEAGGAIGVLAKVGPPMRGPGGGRTFEEALAAPRNP